MHSLLATITIWLLTCTPGSELYSRYGHTALRVQDTDRHIDWCFNYGTFSFHTDHFYWKFVRGETYYLLTYEPTESFFFDYIVEHRTVYEQELNLCEEDKKRMVNALLTNAMPEKRAYLYNFVFDNCCTRPLNLIQQITGDSLTSTYSGYDGQTYRHFLQHYTRSNTLINSLINTIFGYRADLPMHGQQRLFLPEELMLYMQEATFADGTPVVIHSQIGPFVIPKARWWENVWFYIILFVLFMTGINLYDRHRKRCSWGIDIALGIGYLILLTIVIFLTYFSIHPLVGFNWRLLVLPAIHLCTRLIYILR